MTEIVPNSNRQQPRCQGITRLGQPCKAFAATSQNGRLLCRVHGGLVDQAELGRRSAASRKARKSKRVPFEEQVEAELDEPGMGKRLLS